MAPGTAIANKRAGGRGITIVQGGDAGTAEGDFSTCLVWSSRPGHELPCLMIVANNHWGISTPASEQHAEKHIADRGKPFGIKSAVIDGNDPEVVLPRAEEGDGLRARRAAAVPPRGHGVAPLRSLVGVRRELRPRRGRLPGRVREAARGAQDPRRAPRWTSFAPGARRSCSRRASACAKSRSRRATGIWEHVFAERDLVHTRCVGPGTRTARPKRDRGNGRKG